METASPEMKKITIDESNLELESIPPHKDKFYLFSESFSVVLSFFTFFFLFELQYRKTDNPPLIIRATEKKELHIENSFTYPNNVS